MNAARQFFTPANQRLSMQLLVVVGLLLISRLGSFIPLPGFDFYGFVNNVGGSEAIVRRGVGRHLSLFALGIWPYIYASMCAQLTLWAFPGAARLSNSTAGRRRLGFYIRIFTVVLTAFQAQGIATALEAFPSRPDPFLLVPSWVFHVSTIATLTAGVMILVWLSEEITKRGFGDGVLFILFVQYFQVVPTSIEVTMQAIQMGILTEEWLVGLGVGLVGFVGAIVFMESARRPILVEPDENAEGGANAADFQRAASVLALRVNPSGIVTPILSEALVGLALIPVAMLVGLEQIAPEHWLISAIDSQSGRAGLLAISAPLAAFALGATAIRSRVVALVLAKIGAVLPEAEPGESSEAYIDYVQRRMAFLGAAYLTILLLLPKAVFLRFNLPYPFGGLTLLVMVLVCLNIVRAFQQKAE
jgi:preprotein translocase subunit SecY